MNILTGCVFVTILASSLLMHSVAAHANGTSTGTIRLHIVSQNPVSYKITESTNGSKITASATIQPFSETDIVLTNVSSVTTKITETGDAKVGCTAQIDTAGQSYSITSRSDAMHNTQCQIQQASADTVKIIVTDKHV